MWEIDAWPRLREPVLVTAFRGWVDAGDAGTLASGLLAQGLEGARVFGRCDLSDLLDLSQTRPQVWLENGVQRRIDWPTVELTAGHAERDVIVCAGPEPSLRWPSFTRELGDLCVRLGVSYVATVAGVPAVSSHRQPVSVLVSASSPEVARAVDAVRTDYFGPTGVQTVLQGVLAEAGIPGVGLWAQVPHYVATNPSPPAARALLTRLAEITGVRVDLAEVDAQVERYTNDVEQGLAARPDVAELVAAIETESGEAHSEQEASGETLAAEIERFLRGQAS